jgi:tetratricopeptide (TPR) repeat protein
MASAELEIAKDLIEVGDLALKGRLDAFLAHLWLRRGQMDEVKVLMADALKFISGELERAGAANLGMAFLVWAETLATNKRWEEANEIFDQAVQVFRTSRYGLYFEALALAWYGETLLNTGRDEEGRETLVRARDTYQRMSNESQANKINAIMAGLK